MRVDAPAKSSLPVMGWNLTAETLSISLDDSENYIQEITDKLSILLH